MTVVDQTGALLTAQSGDSTASLTSSQFDYRKQVESDYTQRIQSLVGSIVGADRVRASVSAEIDFTETEQTRESFDPNVQMVRSEQTSEDTRRGDGMQGVPGALSNQPPEVAGAPAGAARCRDCRSRQHHALADAQFRARQDREPYASSGRLD